MTYEILMSSELRNLRPWSILGPILIVVGFFADWIVMPEIGFNGQELFDMRWDGQFSEICGLPMMTLVMGIPPFIIRLTEIPYVKSKIGFDIDTKDIDLLEHIYHIAMFVPLIWFSQEASRYSLGIGAGFWICAIGILIVGLRSLTDLTES